MLEYRSAELPSPDHAELTEFGTNRAKFLAHLRNQINTLPKRPDDTPYRPGWYEDLTDWMDTNRGCASEPDEPINWDELLFDPAELSAAIGRE
jgi:hypothetical protein